MRGSVIAGLARADSLLLRLNLLVLLLVVFLPFPTRLVADALHQTGAERVDVTLYGLTLLVIRLLGPVKDSGPGSSGLPSASVSAALRSAVARMASSPSIIAIRSG